MSMVEIERLDESIVWIDLSFVERRRTPEWAIQVGIRWYLAGISLRDVSQNLESLGVERSHVTIHEWVHKVDLQPISTVTADQVVVDEKMIRVNDAEHWLYGAVDPETNEIIHLSLFPSTTKQTTRWFLAELHRRCQLGDPEFLVDSASYLSTVLNEDGYRLQVMSNGNRNAIEYIFSKV